MLFPKVIKTDYVATLWSRQAWEGHAYVCMFLSISILSCILMYAYTYRLFQWNFQDDTGAGKLHIMYTYYKRLKFCLTYNYNCVVKVGTYSCSPI